MNIIAIIPARMGSTRFPGKPLALLHGMPMLGHVAMRTRLAPSLAATFVATCDRCIEDYCHSTGIDVVMTGAHHERCSTRTAEALLTVEERLGKKVDVVVMVQGDEPMVTPSMIESALQPLYAGESSCAKSERDFVRVVNLMTHIDTCQEWEDPNCIKVLTDIRGDALYFSRAPLPCTAKPGEPRGICEAKETSCAVQWPFSVQAKKQVCIIPFRRDALLHFNALPEGLLEKTESIDMLRFLEHGERVRMVLTNERTFSVDTERDLQRVIHLMENDVLRQSYGNACGKSANL